MTRDRLSREQLHARLGALKGEGSERMGARDRLVHELLIHQIELEVQNHELEESRGALEESRKRYADLYDFAPIACFIFDPAGVVLEVNLSGAALIGKTRAQIVGAPFISLVHALDYPAFHRHLARCMAGELRVASELGFSIEGRGPITVQATSSTVAHSDGRQVVRTALTDVTERRAERRRAFDLEHRLRSQFEGLDRAAITIAQALATLSDTGPRALLQVIADQTRVLIDAEYAGLLTGIEPDQGVRHWVFSGMSPQQAAAIGRSPERIGLLGTVARDGHTIRVPDLSRHPAFVGFPANHPTMGSFLGVPVRFGSRMLGFLYLTNKRGAPEFSELDEQGAELMAEHVAVILEIARLHELEARDRERLELLARASDVLAATLDRGVLGEQMGGLAIPWFADFCMVGLLDAGRLTGVSFAHSDPVLAATLRAAFHGFTLGRDGAGVFAKAWRSGQPELQPDLERPGDVLPNPEVLRDAPELTPRSVLVVPMLNQGEVEGVIGFVYGGSGRRYAARDIPIAEEIARRCMLALENARLFDEVRCAVDARDRELASAKAAIAAREGVLRIVAHDLRSPLAGIRMLADSLLRQSRDGPTHRPLDMLRRTVDRMDRIIQDLLDVARLDGGTLAIHPGPVSVPSVVNDSVDAHRLAAADAGLEILGEVIGEPPIVNADRGRLLQAIDNLLANAIKFSSEGGGVTVRAEVAGNDVVFSVQDTGPGIPAEHLPHLFERFWQGERADRRGAGLGLSIVKGIADAHGGSVRVESEVGTGSTFQLVIPALVEPGCVD